MDIGETQKITERPRRPTVQPVEMPDWLNPNKITSPVKEPVTVGS